MSAPPVRCNAGNSVTALAGAARPRCRDLQRVTLLCAMQLPAVAGRGAAWCIGRTAFVVSYVVKWHGMLPAARCRRRPAKVSHFPHSQYRPGGVSPGWRCRPNGEAGRNRTAPWSSPAPGVLAVFSALRPWTVRLPASRAAVAGQHLGGIHRADQDRGPPVEPNRHLLLLCSLLVLFVSRR